MTIETRFPALHAFLTGTGEPPQLPPLGDLVLVLLALGVAATAYLTILNV